MHDCVFVFTFCRFIQIIEKVVLKNKTCSKMCILCTLFFSSSFEKSNEWSSISSHCNRLNQRLYHIWKTSKFLEYDEESYSYLTISLYFLLHHVTISASIDYTASVFIFFFRDINHRFAFDKHQLINSVHDMFDSLSSLQALNTRIELSNSRSSIKSLSVVRTIFLELTVIFIA